MLCVPDSLRFIFKDTIENPTFTNEDGYYFVAIHCLLRRSMPEVAAWMDANFTDEWMRSQITSRQGSLIPNNDRPWVRKHYALSENELPNRMGMSPLPFPSFSGNS